MTLHPLTASDIAMVAGIWYLTVGFLLAAWLWDFIFNGVTESAKKRLSTKDVEESNTAADHARLGLSTGVKAQAVFVAVLTCMVVAWPALVVLRGIGDKR